MKAWHCVRESGREHLRAAAFGPVLGPRAHASSRHAEATEAPRIHHQWLPDELRVETGISPDTVRLLEALGHKVTLMPVIGSTRILPQSLEATWERLTAAVVAAAAMGSKL